VRQFLDLLDDEWKYLATSTDAIRALIRWAPDAALEGFADLDAVIDETQRRGRPAESDRILLALLRRAATDPVAARTVLQAVMPGLKSLMSAYRLTGEPEEVSTAVIEAAFERIRSYPCDRRPSRVAANLLNDIRQSLWRAARKERRLQLVTVPLTETALETAAREMTEPSSTDELVGLVAEGVRLRHVAPSGARVILLTRVLDVSMEELAGDTGAKSKTIRKRRDRAEAALARMAVA
jgi:DNA-directed RNA polymerase specialized sigma24 family protein